jgi:xanthine dehydrogenase accessory factor
MTDPLTAALAAIDRTEPAILVEVTEVLGSTPREAGTVMLVTDTAIFGTIGGGELEWRAMQRAREALAGEPVPERIQLPLGPALQQCCGGHVTLTLTRLDAAQRDALALRLQAQQERLPRVVLFGAGHVGQALATALAPLPCRLRWLDSRPAMAPAEHVPDPAAFRTEPSDLVLVMTHSHGLDLAIVEARLRHEDFAWLGLIGSATKRRRFEGQLMAAGIPAERLTRLVCPIGLASIKGKEPAVIAASVAAQLLAVMEALAKGEPLRSVA